VGMRETRRLAQVGGDGVDMRVAASAWRIGGVVGAGVCEAVWWWMERTEASAAKEGGDEEKGEGGECRWQTAAEAAAMSERRSRPALEGLGVFEGCCVDTRSRVELKGVMDGWLLMAGALWWSPAVWSANEGLGLAAVCATPINLARSGVFWGAGAS
jgi:hypothetical protein